MIIILTGEQSICYCTFLRNIPIYLFSLYKILDNVLFLIKGKGIKVSLPCSFCNLYDETPFHIFYECETVLNASGRTYSNAFNLILPTLTPQSGIFGITNHILLIFKLYVYKSRIRKVHKHR